VRARRGARDCFTGQANRREVTVGAAPVTSIEDLRAEIRSRIGPQAVELSHCCDVFVSQVCRYWPERHMATLARQMTNAGSGAGALDALAVVTAKCREDLEARWKLTGNNSAALDLLLQAVVIEMANLWFSSAEMRIALRTIIFQVRGLTT
jgi:hypothetical protein